VPAADAVSEQAFGDKDHLAFLSPDNLQNVEAIFNLGRYIGSLFVSRETFI
jgi:hypothetical protein